MKALLTLSVLTVGVIWIRRERLKRQVKLLREDATVLRDGLHLLYDEAVIG